METDVLKMTHPQKYSLKVICNLLYYLGLGDCWYEDRSPSVFRKFYRIWAVISNLYLFTILADEVLSHFRKDLSMKEKNDLIQLSIAHPLIGAKIFFLYLRRDRIKVVLKRLLEDNRSVFPSSAIDKESVKLAITYFLIMSGIVYLTLVATTVDAVITHIKEGIPIRIEVTLFPSKSDSGFLINIMRLFIEFHFWYILSAMLFIDSLSIFSLTFISFKFKRVRLYFESLRERFSVRSQIQHNATNEQKDQFWKDFVVGIKLHEDALWCSRNVQRALGVFYSVQVVEGIGLLVICLFKLVTMERNLSLILANLAFILALVVMTGTYMMAGAEITYEASLISTAIFHCGWDHAVPVAGQRTLVLVAIQRSQVPVHMTAFGIIVLSYSNFITVLRSSYSFFAVMF